MKENIVYGFIVYEKPVESYFDYILEHNIRHLEIDLKKKHSQLRNFSPKRIARIRDFSLQHDISLSLHPPYNLNLCSRSPIVRQYIVSYLKKCILLAHRLKAGYITLHLGNYHRSAIWSNPRHYALERLLKSLRKLLPVCEEYGVCLALENVIPIPPEAGFSFLGDNMEDFQYIFSNLQSDYLQLCLDTGHANTNEGPIRYIARFSDKIIGTHVHDNRGRYDDHMDIGKGTIPWSALMVAFEKIKFYGPYVSECFTSQPHEAKKQLFKYLP